MRPASVSRARLTSTTSAEPFTRERASRSPPPSRRAMSVSVRIGRVTERAMRSATRPATAMSTTPRAASAHHAAQTPRSSSWRPTLTRTTVVWPAASSTGRNTSTPPAGRTVERAAAARELQAVGFGRPGAIADHGAVGVVDGDRAGRRRVGLRDETGRVGATRAGDDLADVLRVGVGAVDGAVGGDRANEERQRHDERDHDHRRDRQCHEDELAAHRTRRLVSRSEREELDADTAHRVQVARRARALAQLAAQPREVRVDRLLGAAVRLVPDLGEELLLGDDGAAVARQVEQEVELLAAQLERLTGERRGARRGIDHEVGDLDRGRAVAREPPQQRSDAGVDLLGRERLHDVLVGAGVEQPDDLPLVVARGADDHGDVAHRSQHLQEVAAVDVGEAEVEDHDVGRLVDDRLQRGQSERRLGDPVAARGERVDERDPDAIVVLDDEHLGHAARVRRNRRRSGYRTRDLSRPCARLGVVRGPHRRQS